MKRDLQLIKRILLAIEEEYENTILMNLSIEGYSMQQVANHAELLYREGLLSRYKANYADDQLWSFAVGNLTNRMRSVLLSTSDGDVKLSLADIIYVEAENVYLNIHSTHGDYRTRMTHTIEVARIARTIANGLGLNTDLAEAAAMGHDLGHTPFGHAGERALSEAMGQPFRHNEQSLRVVDILEKDGLEKSGRNAFPR